MDKDSERERKHQQQQNERQQEIVIATGGSVDEHFEESLRRAKEKHQQQQQQQQQQRSPWNSTLPLSVHPPLSHSSILMPGMLTSAPQSVLAPPVPPTQATISITSRTDLSKSSQNLSQLNSQQLYEAQRKVALGIPPNYQADRSRKEFDKQRNDYFNSFMSRMPLDWSQQAEIEKQQQRVHAQVQAHVQAQAQQQAQQAAQKQAQQQAQAQQQKQMQYSQKYAAIPQQQSPSAKPDLYKLGSDAASITPIGYSFAPYIARDSKGQLKEHPSPQLLHEMQQNSQSGVIVKHDTKSSQQKSSLHQPYANIPSSVSHHPAYDSYPSAPVVNNSDRYARGLATISTSPQNQQQPPSQKQSPQPSHRQTPPNSSYNMIVVGNPAKQKVSSPAPSHVYGKPEPASPMHTPHNRTQEVPQPHPAVKPIFHQQIYGPPMAHTSRTPETKQIYPSPTSNLRPQTHSVPISGIPLQLSSSPLPPPPESHTSGVSPHHLDVVKNFSTSPKMRGGPSPVSEQTQPLDLGVASSSKSRENDSGRRKASPFPVTSLIETKKMRTEPPSSQISHTTIELLHSQQLNLSQKETQDEKKPKFEPMQVDTPSPQGRITPKSVEATNNNNNNSNSGSATPTPPSTPQLQNTTTEAPKVTTTTQSTTTTTNQTTTTTTTSSFTAPRHLKKAWLQRHTGEDIEDTTGVIGSGNCIKLPLKLENAAGQIKTNTLVTGNGKEEPAANNVKEENNSVSENKLVQMKKGRETSNSNNVQSNSNNNKDETNESNEQKDASGSDIESESEKNSDTDKESVSGKSDSGTKRINNGTRHSVTSRNEPRKRGRKPKLIKEEINLKKKQIIAAVKAENDPFCKPPIAQLKKTGEPFLQDGPCFEVAPKLAKCRECRLTPSQRFKTVASNIFCRFYAFRKLKYNKNGQLAIAGFSDPIHDPKEDDLKLWVPDVDSPPPDLDLQVARFLLAQVADQFCDLLHQEKEALKENMSDDKTVAWKRVVQGVREMCDVCETTLFNFHWVCEKCGFVVCIDCYKSRKHDGEDEDDKKKRKLWGEPSKDRDEFSWLLCSNRSAHDQERLMLTQIIAGDSLNALGRQAHELRALWDIQQYCGCPMSKDPPPKAMKTVCKEYITKLLKNENAKNKSLDCKNNSIKVENDASGDGENQNSLKWLADVALKQEPGLNGFEDDKNNVDKELEDDDGHSALRNLLTRPSSKNKDGESFKKPPKKTKIESNDVIGKYNKGEEETDITSKSVELKHFITKNRKKRSYMPIRIMTHQQSNVLYPNIPHQWLCDGKLLRLLDPHADNFRLFQEQWKRGQPVICSDVSKKLNMNLWTPEAFSNDFGEDKNDLINCMSGNIVPNQPMKKFWDGFEHLTRRLKDDNGQMMLLKLKDWPPAEDFAEIMPTRFTDLMKALPLGDYTQREGKLNLASRLPDCFVRPDLGPKMYNAYGSALYANKGTTNLHLDISDAVNVMVYVGIPRDGNADEHIKEAFRAIDSAGCDILTRRRVREKNELPGALWHIYAAKDADKIRDLLNKVRIENGERLSPDQDPIHDQSWYLDGPLRERLYKEYGVEGYPIVQCLGDAVFVPAGTPHQVRNLHNCIKVAEDFVSPENVSHSFQLTQEFRELSDTHSNHEDKLQIKNIIYHTIKDAIACLSHLVSNEISESQSSSFTFPNQRNNSPNSSSSNTLQSNAISTSVKL
ncbi:lysine-specific demethylase 3A isoform X2 [Culicoides brevitarsis]|uniref:lysine-specific demethylase 3A isoform X2 n=1 Tax=Culicoides brevitarsis TaxID=469753 RepID=UPI00307B5A1D